jgi:hypothetical protein
MNRRWVNRSGQRRSPGGGGLRWRAGRCLGLGAVTIRCLKVWLACPEAPAVGQAPPASAKLHGETSAPVATPALALPLLERPAPVPTPRSFTGQLDEGAAWNLTRCMTGWTRNCKPSARCGTPRARYASNATGRKPRDIEIDRSRGVNSKASFDRATE